MADAEGAVVALEVGEGVDVTDEAVVVAADAEVIIGATEASGADIIQARC